MSRDIPPLYHISFDRHLPLVMTPREPWGSEIEPTEDQKEKNDPDDWIFAEFRTPRVSFSPTILHCVQAVYANTHQLFQSARGLKEGLEFAVYRHDPRKRSRIMFPEDLCAKRAVWDAHITQEYCFLDPVTVYYCGNIIAKLKGPIKGMQVHPFNDKSMKTIQSNVPDGDDLIFSQSVRLKGDKYRVQFF